MTKLLNIDANAKTVKGQKKGYMTAVMYLAPYKTSGINVCPFAKLAGCWQTCLNTAGRGGMSKAGATFDANGITLPDNAIQRARIWRTQLWANHREEFWRKLIHEIDLFLRAAERKGLTPVVRLNGTSDIQWERQAIPEFICQKEGGMTIFEMFPHVQFYDYTKIPKRLEAQATWPHWPKNYYSCLSYSEADNNYATLCWHMHDKHKASIVVVARDKKVKERLLNDYAAVPATDGDEHDLRFLDPPGALVVLKAKGSARRETNGFVLD